MMVLYTTAHCTLCEEALDWVLSMPELAGSPLTTVDVAYDDALMTRFGERVPVLALGGEELAWPFDADQVRALVNG